MTTKQKTALILGGSGMLGKAVHRVFPSSIALSKDTCNILDSSNIRACIQEYKPDIIINCAAYTKVDLAETETETAFAINAQACIHIAQGCAENNIELIHISTDYVFDGQQEAPYQEDSFCNPLSVYGKSKHKGEENILSIFPKAKIVRTQWLYGLGGKNFVETMLSLAKNRASLSIISDQVGSPTNTHDLAKALYTLSSFPQSGIFHIRNEGFASWYEFATEIFRLSENPCQTIPISTSDYPLPAQRPQYSKLGMNRWKNELQCSALPHWKKALQRYILARQ